MRLLSFFNKRKEAVRFAISGVIYTLKTQKNTWIHAGLSVMVLGLGIWLNISGKEWAIIILTIGFVWATEFVNTAIEAVVDLACPVQNPLAKISKDVSAAAVLTAAITAILVGLLILGPSLWQKMALLLKILS